MRDAKDIGKEHDREIIEKSFKDFEKNYTFSEDEMEKIFGKYGWGSREKVIKTSIQIPLG